MRLIFTTKNPNFTTIFRHEISFKLPCSCINPFFTQTIPVIPNAMESQLNQERQAEKEIQVYHNEFYRGILVLARKLFML
jgi:hypothetical protein